LLRHTPWYARRGLHALCAAVMVGSVAAGSVLSLRPPQMVRSAIEHEYYERTLRGQFIRGRDCQAYGLACRPEAARLYPAHAALRYRRQSRLSPDHFFEKGGIVTVLAFEQPQRIADGQGWWANSYWQVVRSREGPLVLIAQKKQALAVASRALGALRKPMAEPDFSR
jgi:hypothetical protein